MQKRKLKYRTEHEKVAFFIKTLNLKDLLGPHSLDEIVVLLDSGYDSKVVQNAILSRNVDFTVSIKSTRTIFLLIFLSVIYVIFQNQGYAPHLVPREIF